MTIQRHPMGVTRRLAALVLVGAVLVAACGAADDDSSGETAQRILDEDAAFEQAVDDGAAADDGGAGDDGVVADGATEEPAEESPEVAESGGDDAAGDGEALAGGGGGQVPVPDALAPDDLGRDIIRTGRLQVEADDVGVATTAAFLAVEGVGGYLFGQEARGEPDPFTVLTFKVPPTRFQDAMARLGEVGTLQDSLVTSDDVTEQIVDLESRITTAEASVERLREFLTGANNLDDVARLENQLLVRETDLEQLKGQLRTLENRVDLATIVLTITQAPVEVPDAAIEVVRSFVVGHDGGTGCGPDVTSAARVDEGDAVTVCWVVTNDGDAALAELVLVDRALDVELEDLLVVTGRPDEVLAPGAQVVLALEHTATSGLSGRVHVQAVPVDGDGTPLGDPVADEDATSLSVAAVDALPGFLDALGASWSAVTWIVGVGVIVVGGLVPFLPLVALLAFGWHRLRRRTSRPATGHEVTAPEPG